MIPVKFSHIGLTCNDPGKIENFYNRYFNFIRTDVYNGNDGTKIIMLYSDEIGLELFKSTEPPPFPNPAKDGYNFSGWRHICFQVDRIDEKLKELGNDLRVTLGPLTFSGMKLCWISDPEGNIIELCQKD